MAPSDRIYQGEPTETRVRERRRRLIDTAFELMAADGWRQVTIHHLCREAKLHKRYFYESFSDLDELAAAIVDDLATQLVELGIREAAEAAREGLATDALARKVIAAVVGVLLDEPQRARVLFTEVASCPRAIARRHEAVQAFAQTLSTFGHAHHGAGDATDPIAPLAASILISGSIGAVLSWLDGHIPMSREQFVDDLASMWVVTGDGAVALAKARS